LIVVASIACGQKGPPLPPLVRTPAPPELRADRRGSMVELGFTVPNANADGTRPANIARIDIYAVTGATTLTDLEMMKWGTRVASVPVKAPRNPNDTVEPGESADVIEPPAGEGLDQGAASAVVEQIAASIFKPIEPDRKGSRRRVTQEPDGPLLGPSAAALTRTYVGVGLDKRGRPGKFSPRVVVPLVLAPPPPSQPVISYTETAITVRWSPPSSGQTADPDLLPSTPIGPSRPPPSYHVYDSTTDMRLTKAPLTELQYEDSRIEWGAMRCYAVRTVEVAGQSALESEAGEPKCETLVDTFPPKAPKGLNAVSTDGAISLIWESNTEPDLAGYIVLRARTPATKLDPVTPPIPDASYVDNVERGIGFVYAVQAVDKAGNVSAPSNPVEGTAR
jgi:hypothetical protein